tara:strand:- start:129 stop:461 length:333 start_codon:yes stop_codon:yes gene_type:complete
MGILHGITNLGGSLLSAIIFNKNLSKDSKRATIAVCYLTFAAFQIITIAITFNNNALFNELNFIYWLSGSLIFFFVQKYIFFRIDEGRYVTYSNFFLFIIGIVLIVNSLY